MDIENLDAGQKFSELPETYTIFVTEKDLFGDGNAVYAFEMKSKENRPLNDGAHIVYVNGEYRGEDALGLLMHDFNCVNAGDMHYDLMSDRTRYLKENPEGVSIMCKAMEDMRMETIEKDRMEQARKYYAEGVSLEIITRVVERPVEVVMKWLGIISV